MTSDVPSRLRLLVVDDTGSPTVLVDGSDPFATADATPALACRVYSTAAGPAGVPDRGALRDVLRAALRPMGRA